MITVAYEKPFTNVVENDVNTIRQSYLADLAELREYYGKLFAKAAFDNHQHGNLRRIV